MPESCIIFDFDGVIADTECLHLHAYNAAFSHHAEMIGGPLTISPSEYFSRYVVYGDVEGFSMMLRHYGRPHDEVVLHKLAAAKHEFFTRASHGNTEPLPGVREMLTFLENSRIPHAICSGARRAEIVHHLEVFNLLHHFDVIVSIEDVQHGKPDPEGYNLAFEKLNEQFDAELSKSSSLVIEDSAGGIAAGQAAGLRVLGVATSLPLEELRRHATFAVNSLADVSSTQLAEWLQMRQ